MNRRLLSILLTFLLLGLSPLKPALAQVEPAAHRLEYTFGVELSLHISFPTSRPVQSATVFLQTEGKSDTRQYPLTQGEGKDWWIKLDLNQEPLQAFTNLNYWFEASIDGAQPYKSPLFNFYYEDNRFNWQTREEPPFRLHWYEGEEKSAQTMLDVARQSLERAKTILPVGDTGPVNIYAYATAMEMQATLIRGGQNWVSAGHASPDQRVMVVTLPSGPEQRLLMEQRIPHELMHILTYQKTGPSYSNLPLWLREGLASIAELYQNPDYLVLLESAQEKESLLPLTSLCSAFPQDASGALLAYAEVASFTRFLHEQYGSSGLQNLVSAYADGVSCERGVQVAFGSTLVQLESQWRQVTFGENAWQSAAAHLLPWLVILLVVLGAPLALALSGFQRRKASPVET